MPISTVDYFEIESLSLTELRLQYAKCNKRTAEGERIENDCLVWINYVCLVIADDEEMKIAFDIVIYKE